MTESVDYYRVDYYRVDYYRVDYYLTPTSPWTYLGHERFAQIAKRHGAAVAVKPVDYGVIFPQSAACLICAAPQGKQMAIAGDFLRAVWAEERNIADRGVLADIVARHGLADAPGAIAQGKAIFESNTQEAVARQVFGAPTFACRDELFWGQDRLDFFDRALAK